MTLTKLQTAHACEIKVYLALCYDYRACECCNLVPRRVFEIGASLHIGIIARCGIEGNSVTVRIWR